MPRPILHTPPVGEVVSVDALMRKHCRVDGDDDDAVIAEYITAAVSHLDGYTGALGRCILEQRWAFPVDPIETEVRLRFPDCRAFTVERLVGETWTPEAGVTVTDCLTHAELEGLPSDREGLYLLADAGWANPAAVPVSLRQAIRMLAVNWYDHRGATATGYRVQDVPFGVDRLLAPYRFVAV